MIYAKRLPKAGSANRALHTSALLFGFFVALAGCGSDDPDRPQQLPVPASDVAQVAAYQNVSGAVEYVGDAACASCHGELVASYQEHGMAQAYYPLTEAVRVEPALAEPVIDPNSGFEYTIVEAEGTLWQEEILRDEKGAVIHRLRRRVDEVVGSGSAARTYLTVENGRRFELPLTWYTQAEKWDFSPG
ncbi:MAG: hypothetical protein AAGI08_08265, partial [Bacteroidota bacterium]